MTYISIKDDNGNVIIDNINIKDLSLEVKKLLINMLSLQKLTERIYNGYGSIYKHRQYQNTGVKRKPKEGEYYLSGAKAEVYQALHDLDTEFYIAKEI